MSANSTEYREEEIYFAKQITENVININRFKTI